MNNEELVIKAKRGDDRAFYELIQSRKEILYRTAFAFVKNKDDALDIVSDSVLKAYLSISKLRDNKLFHTWLTRILINSAKDYLKKNQKIITTDYNAAQNVFAINPFNEEYIDLLSALDKLNENYKTIIILKYYQDLTLGEIAQILDYPLGTVKTYLHKALRDLRLDLKGEDIDEKLQRC